MSFGADAALSAIPIVGDVISGAANAKQARENYKHRYQWAVQDIQKAGLNPALAYGQNQPIPQTQPLNLGDAAAKGITSASQAKTQSASTEYVKAQTSLLKAQAADLIEGVKIKNALMYTQAQQAGAQSGLTMMQQEQLQLTMESMRMDNEFKRATLAQRIEMVARELKAKGIEIERAILEKQLRAYDRNRKISESKFFGQTGSASQWLQMLKAAASFVP